MLWGRSGAHFSGWDTGHLGAGSHITNHHGPSSDQGAFTNPNALADHCASSNMHALL
jgi:hypothetical protein